MKHPVRILSLFLALILLAAALPLTAHAQEFTFPKADSARIIAADDGTLRAKWEIDYAALPEAYSVSHTLVFYKANNYTSEWNILTLTAEGRVNELDLTEYKEWYFGDSESRYFFELTTRYSVVNDGITSATTMNPVTSAKEYLYKAMMNNAALTQVTLSPYHEGDPYLYTDVTWTNMQFGYKLRCDISVNGGEEMSYLVTPVYEDAGINGTARFDLAATELDVPLKAGDSVMYAVQLYKVVNSRNEAVPLGAPLTAQMTVQDADPSMPLVTNVGFPGIREGSLSFNMDISWQNNPLEDCKLNIIIAVNDNDEQTFTISQFTGDNAVKDGTRRYSLQTNQLRQTLAAGDTVHFKFLFVRKSDGRALGAPCRADVTVKTKTVTEYQTNMTFVAVCCKTGEYGEITLTDEEKALSPIQQNTIVTEKVNAWGAERGFAENSCVMGGYNISGSTFIADGVPLSESEYFSPDFDANLYDRIVTVSSPTFYLLFREPAVWGDVDGDGEATAMDATWICRYAATYVTYEQMYDIPFGSFSGGDVDQSGDVTVMDATFIQHWLANMRSDYPIGEPIPA